MSPVDRDDSVDIGKSTLCSDEVGVDFVAYCHLENDNQTVTVFGTFDLFEGAASTCGGSELETSHYFEFSVPPGELRPGSINLSHPSRASTRAPTRLISTISSSPTRLTIRSPR